VDINRCIRRAAWSLLLLSHADNWHRSFWAEPISYPAQIAIEHRFTDYDDIKTSDRREQLHQVSFHQVLRIYGLVMAELTILQDFAAELSFN
jgi:hypothetical protein